MTEAAAGTEQPVGLESRAPERAEDAVGNPSERVGGRWSPILGVVAIAVYVAIVATGYFHRPLALLVLLCASQVVDIFVIADDYVRSVLARAQLGVAARTLIRELATAALVIGAGWADPTARRVGCALVLAQATLRLLYQLVLVPVRRRANLPIETRGIDLAGLRLPPIPHPLLMTRISERTHGLSVVGVVAAALAVVLRNPTLLYAVEAAVLLVLLAGVVALGVMLLRGNRALDRDGLLSAVAERVGRLHPEVMLYHSGDDDSAYQVDMWLGAVDQLRRSSLVMLRERRLMRDIAPCATPVLCIPDPVHFMTFRLPDVRVAMYTANVGKTIHMLRVPGVRHVFIGHGDSDKTGSSNPFSKVYSEIWVAGPAGRDRYRRANIGIHDEDIIEVGRPQLSGIEPRRSAADGVLTVLYAPTWEGWTNDPAHTSVVRTGPKLVARLLALPGVRVLYKPHPFTGRVTVAAATADATIRASIAQAGSPHAVVVGAARSLYDCFNDSDVLVADISSVLSDFIESQKPYVVANLTGRPDEEFRAEYPSVSAAYLIDPDAESIGSVLDLVRGTDPMDTARADLKHYLLGADEPDAMTKFERAVDAARDRAIALCPERALTVDAEI